MRQANDRPHYDLRTGDPLGFVCPGRMGRWFLKRLDGTITPARWETAEDAEKALRAGKA